MRRFLCFWLDCARIAIRGSVVFANNWQWLFGIPIVAGILGFISAKRNIAQLSTGYPILDGLLVALGAFIVTWTVSFLARLINAPVELYSREIIRADAAQARLGEATAAPDVTIETDKDPLVFERESVPEAAGRPPGILIVFRDVKIINRSSRNLSVGFRLRIWLRPGFYHSLDQTSVRAWDTLSDEEAASRIIGPRFPEVIGIGASAVESGSLAFFIPSDDDNVKRSVFLSLMNRFSNGNIGDLIGDLPKELEIVEHLSGRRAEIDATTAFSYNMRKGSPKCAND
jgi:hypothetical protein